LIRVDVETNELSIDELFTVELFNVVVPVNPEIAPDVVAAEA
jgi:hypothetical protein